MKRFKAFEEQTKPVVDLYKKFGKVRSIDANGSVQDVYEQTKAALLPQVFFLIGPKSSGKTTLGSALADRTNMHLMNFHSFVRENGLKGKDDQVITQALIKSMRTQIHSRILIEDFPQNEFQANFFFKNCTSPNKVFYVKCSKDTCQERMLELGKDHPYYLSSGILNKKIKKFHDSGVANYLSNYVGTEFKTIDSEQTFQNTFKQMYQAIEPTVIHARSGGSSNELKKSIIEILQQRYSFINLDVNSLIRDENERKT